MVRSVKNSKGGSGRNEIPKRLEGGGPNLNIRHRDATKRSNTQPCFYTIPISWESSSYKNSKKTASQRFQYFTWGKYPEKERSFRGGEEGIEVK